jgi:hypothetical protein
MTLNKNQIAKRAALIGDMTAYIMKGHDVDLCERNPAEQDMAIAKIENLLSDKNNVMILNALAAAFAK